MTLSVGRAGNHPANPGGQYVAETTANRRHRVGWARLLKRVFDICAQRPPNYYDVSYCFRGQDRREPLTRPPGSAITVNCQGEPRD